MFDRKNVGALSPSLSAQSAEGDMCPRDPMPPLIQSFVSYAVTRSRGSAASAVKQLQRASEPLCVASRFQLTQFGPAWLALYESVYWRRAAMMSSLGSASVG